MKQVFKGRSPLPPKFNVGLNIFRLVCNPLELQRLFNTAYFEYRQRNIDYVLYYYIFLVSLCGVQ